MRPDVVTFWHGPLDALRQTRLKTPGPPRPKSSRLQFRAAGAIARRRQERRGRSDPAACLLREASPAATGRHMARLDHIAIQRFFPDAADGAQLGSVAPLRRGS